MEVVAGGRAKLVEAAEVDPPAAAAAAAILRLRFNSLRSIRNVMCFPRIGDLGSESKSSGSNDPGSNER